MKIESYIFRHSQESDRVKPGVDSDGLLDDKTILDELANVLARVGVGNLVDLVGVQPHLWGQSQASNFRVLKIERTLFLPHFMTPAARRFCSLRELMMAVDDLSETFIIEKLVRWLFHSHGLPLVHDG